MASGKSHKEALMAVAKNACAFCASRKRSCDRTLPQCYICLSRGLECHYPGEFGASYQYGKTVAARSIGLEGHINTVDKQQPFPTSFFLDRRVYQQLGKTIPRPLHISEPLLTGWIGDPATLATAYWEGVQWHLPILSVSNFSTQVLNPLTIQNIDVQLLLTAMKLLLWHPHSSPFPHDTYELCRRIIYEAELSGLLSFRLLQARLLLLVFEYGHGIFPAAYLSVAACARTGLALGINKALQVKSTSETALDIEEQRRAWWTILLLDRVIQLGNPTQPLCTDDPAPSDFLPTNDDLYEIGVVSDELFRATSPASIRMSMFVRMCQATYLLGRVLQFHSSTEHIDMSFREKEKLQLDRTLRALLGLVYQEGALDRTHVCVQSSIAYSALVILHDPKDIRQDWAHIETMMVYLRPTAREMTAASGVWFRNSFIRIADASPFLMFWPYHVVTILHRITREHHLDTERIMEFMLEKLRVMSSRWLIGEAYAHIYQASAAAGIPR